MESETPEAALGAQVRRLREARGWSQEALAQRMKEAGHESWRQTTAAKTEAAQRPVRVNEAASLARVFGVALADLLAGPADPADKERGNALHDVLVTTQRYREASRRARETGEAAATAQDEAQRAREARTAAMERFSELQHQARQREEGADGGEHQEKA